MDFTIAIPTYNGAKRLPGVFEALEQQQDVSDISWEVLVVDNNSQDETSQVVQQWQGKGLNFPVRYCFEPQQGLAFARQRAVEVAQGEFVGFLDDDNWPAQDWITEALKFGHNHPNAGSYGSQIKGNFEKEPPKDWKPILFYLALNQRGDTPIQYHPRKEGVPPGAGLVVRRNAWLEQVPKTLFLVGRVGKSMLVGEDSEALLYLYRGKWEIWYNPRMKITHQIPFTRLEPDYLAANMYGVGLSRHYLRMLSLPKFQRLPMTLLYLISDSIKFIVFYLQHRIQLKHDIVAICTMNLLIGTIISPFHIFKLRLEKMMTNLI